MSSDKNNNASKQLKPILKISSASNLSVVSNGTEEISDKVLEGEHEEFQVRQRRRSSVGINHMPTLQVPVPKTAGPNRKISAVSMKSTSSYSKY